MGRPEKALDPAAGPLQRFAHELRLLREQSGSPAYRDLAERTGLSSTTLSEAAAGRKLPSLRVTIAYVRACGGNPAEWERRWQEASQEEHRRPAPGTGDAPPYRGLARYGTDDQGLFFGREPVVESLHRMTAEHRFVALIGASGSGKSSLLRAGLIPAWRDTSDGRPQPSLIRICTPGATPADTHRGLLASAPDGSGSVAVLVDQFEELFTLCDDPGQRATFIDMLLSVRRAENTARVLIAVRADFLGQCLTHGQLAEAVNTAHLLLPAMSRDQLREAIVRPAVSAGLIVERAVTDRIITAVADEPGGLPLMSHTLLELWHRRRGRALTMSAYEALGGVQGAVAHTAEAAFSRLSDEQAQVAKATLLRLVSPGNGGADTRRPVPRTEFQTTRLQSHVVERLIDARLLTTDGDNVELAHEALLAAWPRLRDWVNSERERLSLHRHLTEAARHWEQLGRDDGALYRGVLLARAQAEFISPDRRPASELNESEASFLTAGITEYEHAVEREARTARRTQLLIRALVVLLATLPTVWLIWFLSREHP